MYYIVYQTTNLINSKHYIGVHKTKELEDGYLGSGKYLSKAIRKYGIENFERKVLKLCETPEEMFNMESVLVDADFIARADTYNVKEGGQGGFDHINNLHDKEWRSANARKGREAANKKLLEQFGENWRSEIGKIGAAAKTPEMCKAIGQKALATTLERNNGHGWSLGKKHSKETRQKISKAKKGNCFGEKNSQFGTCWICNTKLQQAKKIKKNDLGHWLKQGWQTGRKY